MHSCFDDFVRERNCSLRFEAVRRVSRAILHRDTHVYTITYVRTNDYLADIKNILSLDVLFNNNRDYNGFYPVTLFHNADRKPLNFIYNTLIFSWEDDRKFNPGHIYYKTFMNCIRIFFL